MDEKRRTNYISESRDRPDVSFLPFSHAMLRRLDVHELGTIRWRIWSRTVRKVVRFGEGEIVAFKST